MGEGCVWSFINLKISGWILGDYPFEAQKLPLISSLGDELFFWGGVIIRFISYFDGGTGVGAQELMHAKHVL